MLLFSFLDHETSLSISVEEEKMTECSKFRLNCAHKNSLFVGFVPQ